MPIPTLPTSPKPVAMKISSRSRSVVSQAESGKILGRSKGSSYYEISLVYPPMRRDQFGPVNAFLQENARPKEFYVIVEPMTGTTGEFIGNHVNFDNDSKLHLITGVNPTVVNPPARNVGGNIVTNLVKIKCSLKTDVQQISLGKDGLVRFEIDVVERI